jgi:glycosyltransferase involved in cell wall biosynthesis
LQVVLSVCRLSVEKDLPTLLKAFAELHRTRPATRLILAGEGPDRVRLESMARDLGLSGVVRLPGRTGQPLAWMRHAAVFVLASQYEGFGNVLIEALACGTPVVSTDCPVGPRELLDGGRLGTLVPVGDSFAMAQAIAEVLEHRELPRGAREAALQYTEVNSSVAYRRLFDGLYETNGGNDVN